MKLRHLLGIFAMLPAALNTSPAAAAARSSLAVPLCTGDGVARVVTVPVGSQDVPGRAVPGCCVKGCQSGERKRGKKCC
jgi:hypothetical protein